MTTSNTVSLDAETDELPRPTAMTKQTHSSHALPRPDASTPDIVDSGRISFGAAMRLPTNR